MAKLSSEEFDNLYLEASNMIYSLGMRLFNSESDANDFVQDVYIFASGKRGKFAGKSKFSTWLYSVAMNFGLSRLKKTEKLQLKSTEESLTDIKENDSGVVNKLIEREFKDEIAMALEKLPETYRLPLVLHYYEELPYHEIAKNLGIKEGTIKSNIHRGKKILRQELINLKDSL